MNHNDISNAMQIVLDGLSLDRKSIWLNRLRVRLLERMFPGDYAAIDNALKEWVASGSKQYDVELSFSLAKVSFIREDYSKSEQLFKELYFKTYRHPHRLAPLEENRWMDGDAPREFLGIVESVPKPGEWGSILCTSLPGYKRTIDVRYQDLAFSAAAGDKVRFGIIFNMKGPQASKVTKI